MTLPQKPDAAERCESEKLGALGTNGLCLTPGFA
jgi:hypothetical protein